MPDDIRFKRLEIAKLAGLSGEYVAAYRILDEMLVCNGCDVEAMRLYGNLLEMDGLGECESLAMRQKFRSARCHYREILRVDPANSYALFDLAEQMVHFRRLHYAAKLYRRFLDVQARANEGGCDDEVSAARRFLLSFDLGACVFVGGGGIR